MLYLVYADDQIVYFAETYAETCKVTDKYLDMGCKVAVCEVSDLGRQRIVFEATNGN